MLLASAKYLYPTPNISPAYSPNSKESGATSELYV